MSVLDRINAGEFKSKLPYPEYMAVVSPDQKAERVKMRADHRADENRLNDECRAALAEENELSGHPKELLLWNLAWEDGHSTGLSDVAIFYERYAELLK